MQKILIIKLGALGDVVLSTPMLKQIIEYHHGSPIWLLTSPPYLEIFTNWKLLNVISFPRKGLMNTLKTLAWIRKQKFSRMYDLQSNDRTAVICALCGISERVGNHPGFPYNLHPSQKYTGQKHIFERMYDVLESAGIKSTRQLPELIISDMDRKTVQDFMKKHNLSNKSFVVLHAGASDKHPQKCWPYFIDLAKFLSQSGYGIVWVGSDADAGANQQHARITGTDSSGLFTINQLAELGRHACFAVTNDSGPMHVLATSGIHVFSFFGPTNWCRHHAIGQEQNVITAVNDNNSAFKPQSLEKISLDQVLARFRKEKFI
jgi:ADP-heptose:LPS heptosyltransferase